MLVKFDGHGQESIGSHPALNRGALSRGKVAGFGWGNCLPADRACVQHPLASHLRGMPEAPAIAVDRLVKVYKTTRAVDGISFALERGSITGLLGGNGAGKTTTIAMILGLVMPTSGSARVLGAEMPRQRYRVLHRMNFESPYVDMPHRLTVRQNLTVFGKLYAVENLPDRIAQIASQLDLGERLDLQTGKLSPGTKP